MNLHNDIMNIPIDAEKIPQGKFDGLPYKLGHRDARHAAAELSLKADARIEELEEALCRTQEDINWMINSGQLLNVFVFDYIDKALNK